MNTTQAVKRSLCVALTGTMLFSTPGIGTYQALAQTAPTAVQVNVSMGGLNVGAAGAGLSQRSGSLMSPGSSLGSGLLTPGVSLGNVGLPKLAPAATAVSESAPAAAVVSKAAPSAKSAPAAMAVSKAGPSAVSPAVAQGAVSQSAPLSAPAAAAVSKVSPSAVSPAVAQGAVSPKASSLSVPNASESVASGASSLQTVRGQENKLGQRFAELKRFFAGARDSDGLKSSARSMDSGAGVETSAVEAAAAQQQGRAPSGLSKLSASQAAASEKPAEPAIPGAPIRPSDIAPGTAESGTVSAEPGQPGDAKKKGWGFGMDGTTWWFILSLLAAQIGVEALGSSMPALIQKAFGDFTIYAQVAVVSSIFGIIGRQLGPMVIEKFGIKKTYVATYVIRVASISTIVALLATGHMTLPLMYIFYSANALLLGSGFTAMNSVPPLLVGQNDASLNRFWGVQHTLSEIFGILGPIATGMVIAKFGFTPALIAFPIATLVAAIILWTTLKLPEGKDLKAASADKKPLGLVAIFKEFGKKIGRGAKVVWSNPALRISFLAYTLFLMLNPFLYQMLAPGYALRIIGTAAPELAPAISGWLTGLYSAGGLLGGIVMTIESRKLDKAKEGGMTKEEEEARMRKSLMRWFLLATGALGFLASMAVPMGTLGSLVTLPAFLGWASKLTLPALALIPFGLAQVVAQFKLQSFFQARVPQKDMADAMGFLGSASLAATTVGIMALKYLFKAFPVGLAPFYYFALALIPLGLLALYLRYRLAKV